MTIGFVEGSQFAQLYGARTTTAEQYCDLGVFSEKIQLLNRKQAVQEFAKRLVA